MRYLSLRNTNGIIINGVNVDVYVGVSPADGGTQILGKMLLTSGVADGTTGDG